MSGPNTFTGAELDRAADGRRADPEWVAAQLADPVSRTLLLGDHGLRGDDGTLALSPLAETEVPGGRQPVLLGLDQEGPVWAIDADGPTPLQDRPRLIGAGGPRGVGLPERRPGWIALREAAAVLSRAEGGLAAYAAGVLNWHRANGFCANCGAATVPGEGGTLRRCPRCATGHHPRTDPVVIMLVTGDDGVLLGRQPSWPERRYSTLAGFVSPGESLEEAVAREVMEEAGVEVGSPAYVSSQPWPFPASLMLGFTVPWASGELGGTDPELQDVRWFSRDQVAEAAGHDEEWEQDGAPGVELQLPPRTAISRRLIEGWLAT